MGTAPTSPDQAIALARSLLGKGLAEIRLNYATESPWGSYGDNDWCAWFVSWLLRANGAGFESWVDNMYRFGPTVSSPIVGDIIIFPNYHVGLVSKIVNGTVWVIDGNGGEGLSATQTIVRERVAWSPRVFVRPHYLTNQPSTPDGIFMALSDAEQAELLQKSRAIYDALFTPNPTSLGSSAGVLKAIAGLEQKAAIQYDIAFKTTPVTLGDGTVLPGGVLKSLKATNP